MPADPVSPQQPYARRVSCNERIYLAAERRAPGFCIQLVVETDGQPAPEALTAAVARAAAANPGVRLVLRGALGFTRWVAAGPVPPVRIVQGWAEGAPPPAAVQRALDPARGPTCEVVLATGVAPRLVFRCFHGVMDASGLVHFAVDVCRALRGEPPLGAPCALNDTEFVTALAGARRRPPLRDAWPALLGRTGEASREVLWQRAQLAGAVPALVAKIAATLAGLPGDPAARAMMMIPVDLRSYRRAPASTGNRTCPVFLEVSAAEGWRAIHTKLLQRLLTKEPLRLDVAERVVPWVPLRLLRFVYDLWVANGRRTGRFPFTALVTHVSLPDAGALSAPDMRARALYLLPTQSDFIPLCVSAVSTPAGTDVVVSGPADLVSSERIGTICDAIRAGVG